MPFSELVVKLGFDGAHATVGSGMYKKWVNNFGIEMVNKVNEKLVETAEVSNETRRSRIVGCHQCSFGLSCGVRLLRSLYK